MPSEKNRRKDDTWTTDELNRALKGSRDELERKRHRRDGDEKRHRDDDDRRERRKHRDDVIGDSEDRRRHRKDEERKSHRDASEDRRRRRKDVSPDDGIRLTEADREKLRQERRERREKKEPGKPEREKRREAPVVQDDDDYSRRRHRDRDDDRRKHRDDDRERRHKDEDRRHKDENEARRRHRDEGEPRRRHRDDDDNRRRDRDNDNKHRHGEKEDHERRRRDGKERDRRPEEDGRDRRRHEKAREDENEYDRDRERQERRIRKEKKEKSRRSDRDEEKRHKGKENRPVEDRHSDRNGERRKEGTQHVPSSGKKKEAEMEPDQEEDGDDYNYDDEDFEDYDEDFEEDDDEEEEEEEENRNENGGEMDDLLKALDEENTRLVTDSRRSNRSDSTDYEENYKEPAPKENRGKTFINFVSAKQVALNSKTASRTKKRGADLLQMIELDVARYDMFDLPPVREYEMYIRSFGRSNTKQAYVQTNEDNIDRDIQTDEIDSKQKWTQQPSEDLLGVGGDGIDPEALQNNQYVGGHGDPAKLAKFVEKAGQTIGILLEEERDGGDGHRQANTKSNVGFSDQFIELGVHKFMQDRHVVHACFCPNQPNMLLTVFSNPKQFSSENPVDRYGLVCAWNTNDLSYPHRILCCEAQPTSCCFSPTKASLAFSGMMDGSVVVWDLRELSSMHRTVQVHDQDHVLRFPTYNTAGVLGGDNHHSPITTILPVHSTNVRSKTEDSNDIKSSLSFQLATLEQNAVVHLWVVTEITSPDTAGSETDLGLAPGGRVKLLKSSSLTLYSPSRSVQNKRSMQVFEMQFLPSDLNHLYVGTDTGYIVHNVRFGSCAFPRGYSPVIESPMNVTTIDFSPFGSPYMLAGCDDGSLHLYHTKREHAFLSWPAASQGQSIRCVRWSRSRPAVFFVLDESSTLHVFDLLENDSHPVLRDQVTPGRAVTMCLTSDNKLAGSGVSSKSPQLLLALDNGRTEIHSIINQLTEQQTLEEEFMDSYVDKF